MRAKRKPIAILTIEALGVTGRQSFKYVKTEPAAQRQKGIMVKDVAELVGILRKKGLI